MRWVLIAAIAACAPRIEVAKPPPAPTPTPGMPQSPDAIPHDFEPSGYALTLRLGETRFDGTIRIAGTVAAGTETIWLHAAGLELAQARASNGVSFAIRPQPLREVVALIPDRPLAAGPLTIEIVYAGPIAGNQTHEHDQPGYQISATAVGLFAQRFRGDRYIYTQFEPMYARRVFPCIDEPDRKVPWQLSLELPAGNLALSNTVVEAESDLPGGRKRVTFAKTPPLPSYLVAFAVGPFDAVDAGRTKTGVPLRIFTQKGRAGDAANAVRWTARLFDLVEDFIGVPYAYGKLDFVAVPATSTKWSAMENPGLVTFNREVLRSDWIRTATHEIAHHWFGDLVTPASWRDIWLNEGFATWVTEKIVMRVHGADALEREEPSGTPTCCIDQHPVSIRAPLDATRTTETLEPYFPGWYSSPLIARFERYMGPAFIDALRGYLKKHAHGLATSEDLAAALGTAGPALLSGIDREIFQPPIISATRVCGTAASIELDIYEKNVVVPVCLAYDDAGARKETCLMVDGPTRIPLATCPRWVIPSGRTAGFFESPVITAVSGVFELAWPVLAADEQQRVLRDAEHDVPLAMRVAGKLLESTDATSIEVAARVLLSMMQYVPDKLRPALDTRIRATIGARARLAFADPVAMLSHKSIIELAALAGDVEVRREAVRRVEDVARMPRELWFLLAIAVQADREAARRALGVLVTSRENLLRSALQNVLAASPHIVDLLKTEAVLAGELPAMTRLTLMSGGCTDASIIEIAALPFREVKNATTTVKACVELRAKMEPAFKAWLARPQRARDTSSK